MNCLHAESWNYTPVSNINYVLFITSQLLVVRARLLLDVRADGLEWKRMSHEEFHSNVITSQPGNGDRLNPAICTQNFSKSAEM